MDYPKMEKRIAAIADDDLIWTIDGSEYARA